MLTEFEKDPEGKRLDGDEWNDSVINELQQRIYSSDAALSLRDDQEFNSVIRGEREWVPSGEDIAENLTLLVNRKVIRGMKGGYVVIRFDTTFENKKFESYYCVLKSNSPMDELHVIEHSIPFFLPVQELEKQHLGKSSKLFFDHMGNVLQAYISRREQVNELKKRKGDLIGELYHSLSYTLIEIMLKEPGWQVGMSLAYHNSDSELPTQSNITVWPLVAHLVSQTAKNSGRGVQKNAAAFRLPINEALFRAMPLPQVCDELIIDLRDTLGLSPLEQAIEAPSASTQSPMEIEIEAPMEFSQEAPH
uniref:Centromere protein O n=1 Tax=Physcomitrium patens TaxID=3218 RepID=A0A7I4DVP9_PHYPA